MGRALILMLASSGLTACGVSAPSGALRIEPLPAEVSRPCPHPSRFLTGGNLEIITGRVGAALLDCERARALAVEAYQAVADALAE